MFPIRFLDKYAPIPSERMERKLVDVRDQPQFVSDYVKKEFDERMQCANSTLLMKGKM
jgi:hypothetical protein